MHLENPAWSSERIPLLDFAADELVQLVTGWGWPRFRAQQLWHWLYTQLAAQAQDMSNLPGDLRARLAQECIIDPLQVRAQTVSEDGLAEKTLFAASDGHLIEAVLLRYQERNTLCISSQIGCALGCVFCATGQSGLVRNLSAGEISAQVLHLARRLRIEGAQVTNVVLMGMGEPLLNLDAVLKSISILNAPQGFGLGARRFTISTVGIVPGIERLAREPLQVGLAVSLHAPNNRLRNKLAPVNRRYPLETLIPACKQYVESTGRRITFEYALARDVNDSESQARATAQLLRGLFCHVNLIPLNPTAGCAYEPSPAEKVDAFQRILAEEGLQATVRLRRGAEIEAGCGQLRSRYLRAATASHAEEEHV